MHCPCHEKHLNSQSLLTVQLSNFELNINALTSRERAQKWSKKCMKLALRNTDRKKKSPGNELTGHPCSRMASGCIGNTATVMNKITVTHTFLTSDNSTEECRYTDNFWPSFQFGADRCR